MSMIDRISGADVVQKLRSVLALEASQQESQGSESRSPTAGMDNAKSAVIDTTQSDARERPYDSLAYDSLAYDSLANVQRMTKVLAAARAQSAGIIGVTGTRQQVGVSVISREIAVASAGFGAKTVLVDLSTAVITDKPEPDGASTPFPSPPSVAENHPSLFIIPSQSPPPLTMTADELRAALTEFVRSGFFVVVDLPPVLSFVGAISPSIAALTAACDLVFLVCLAGQTTEKELSACIAASSIVGFKPSGLILNDWQLPASQLIAD